MGNITTDVLVIGGGAAALRAAVEAAASGARVDLVDKGKVGESGSSPGALIGFSAAFNKEDSDEHFFEDWLRAAGYICDQNLVWEAVTQSRKAAEELEAMGLEFVRNPDGSRSLSRRAGHTVARGLMVKREGPEHTNAVNALRAQAEKLGVRFHDGVMVTKLLQKDSRIIGAVGVYRNGVFPVFSAKAVILAAGGANRLYPNLCSEIVDPKYRTTGDSFCLAFTAGVPLIDMEFTQFRDSPPGGALFGGKYFNSLGERFMEKYAPEALEKAPRYKVAGAVYREVKEGRGPIMWKVENIKEVEPGVPVVDEYANKQWVEITLQFQRVLGGARINERAETPVVGLFAAGESSGGVHGGDRMQGNAFLETQVFGANAGINAAALALNTERIDIEPAQFNEEQARIAGIGGNVDPAEITRTIQETMWEKVGLSRDSVELQEAVAKFEQLRKETAPRLSSDDLFATIEVVNLMLTAEMVARAALAREETRSTHARQDYPLTDDNWLKHVCITNRGGEIAISTLPVVTRLH